MDIFLDQNLFSEVFKECQKLMAEIKVIASIPDSLLNEKKEKIAYITRKNLVWQLVSTVTWLMGIAAVTNSDIEQLQIHLNGLLNEKTIQNNLNRFNCSEMIQSIFSDAQNIASHASELADFRLQEMQPELVSGRTAAVLKQMQDLKFQKLLQIEQDLQDRLPLIRKENADVFRQAATCEIFFAAFSNSTYIENTGNLASYESDRRLLLTLSSMKHNRKNTGNSALFASPLRSFVIKEHNSDLLQKLKTRVQSYEESQISRIKKHGATALRSLRNTEILWKLQKFQIKMKEVENIFSFMIKKISIENRGPFLRQYEPLLQDIEFLLFRAMRTRRLIDSDLATINLANISHIILILSRLREIQYLPYLSELRFDIEARWLPKILQAANPADIKGIHNHLTNLNNILNLFFSIAKIIIEIKKLLSEKDNEYPVELFEQNLNEIEKILFSIIKEEPTVDVYNTVNNLSNLKDILEIFCFLVKTNLPPEKEAGAALKPYSIMLISITERLFALIRRSQTADEMIVKDTQDLYKVKNALEKKLSNNSPIEPDLSMQSAALEQEEQSCFLDSYEKEIPAFLFSSLENVQAILRGPTPYQEELLEKELSKKMAIFQPSEEKEEEEESIKPRLKSFLEKEKGVHNRPEMEDKEVCGSLTIAAAADPILNINI